MAHPMKYWHARRGIEPGVDGSVRLWGWAVCLNSAERVEGALVGPAINGGVMPCRAQDSAANL